MAASYQRGAWVWVGGPWVDQEEIGIVLDDKGGPTVKVLIGIRPKYPWRCDVRPFP